MNSHDLFTTCFTISFIRLQLAALHFNENSSCEQAITHDGKERYDINFPKFKKGGYIVRKVTVEATYSKYNLQILHITCVYEF